MFAYDLILSGEASMDQISCLINCVELFCKVFRHKVNKGKLNYLLL